LWSEQGADLIEGATETGGGGEGLEPARGPVPLLDPTMILLDMVVQIAVRPVRHPVPKDIPNGAWVGIMPIGGDAVRRYPGHGPRGPEESLRRCEIPGLTEAYIHQVAVAVDGPVEVLPSPASP
jgi:hypothetical protein